MTRRGPTRNGRPEITPGARCLNRQCRALSWLSRAGLALTTPFERGDIAAGGRSNLHLTRLAAKLWTMIDRPARFVLPLMHHFVQQRVHRLAPSVLGNVRARHHDLGCKVTRSRIVVPKSRGHAAGKA